MEFEEDETSSMDNILVDAPSATPRRKCNMLKCTSLFEKILVACLGVLLLLVVILSAVLRATNVTEYCVTPACVTVAAAILNAMDQSVDPCTDFYQYSCGGWIRSNPLDDKSTLGTFGKLWQQNQVVMKNILEDDSLPLNSESERKARTYYMSCLDKNKTMDKLGTSPIIDLLSKVGGWNISGDFNISQWNFESSLELLHNQYNHKRLFWWSVGEDMQNSSWNILKLHQGELGLITRDYYLNKSKDDEQVLVAYLNYMTKVGVLLGGEENSIRTQMQDVMDFETKLASIMIPADQEGYHKMTVRELQNLAPVINWTSYFNYGFKQVNREIQSSQELVVYAPEFVRKMSELLTQYLSNIEGKMVISNYLGWSLVQVLNSGLSKPFREASKVLTKALMGSEKGQSRWRYCITNTNEVIGFALGAIFVRERFHGESKPMAENMINEIRDAFKENLPLLKWIDPETREFVKKKADAITDMIGFPEYILDPLQLDKEYDGMEFMENEYFKNKIEAAQFALLSKMKKLDKPTNSSEWYITPPSVNAYYAPVKHQMVFPAGILQAPFYDQYYPKSLNFGAMGVVMGHELTHAFYGQGWEYDKKGNWLQFWKTSAIENYQDRTQCMVDQYSSYEINGENLNGKKTLKENIADNGGLKAAFHAYQDWVKSHPAELTLPAIPLTNNQLFFIGFSQVWCSTSTPEAMHLHMLTNGHSPGKFRVIGTLSNSEDFAREFKCSSKSAMNPEKKCEVW